MGGGGEGETPGKIRKSMHHVCQKDHEQVRNQEERLRYFKVIMILSEY